MTARRLLLLVVLLAALAGCVRDDRYDPLPVPESSGELPPTSTTVAPDLDELQLAGAPGTTTTTPPAIGPGPVTIVGRVDGPDGPVPGAIVHLERVTAGNAVAALDVPTAADGTWNASNVLGGTYRIRAHLAPSLGMLRAQVVFVEALEPKPVVLRVERFEGTRVDGAIAPNPPNVGERANLSVRVTNNQVDPEGKVRQTPLAGLAVTLSGSGSWAVLSANPSITGSDGVAPFVLACGDDGEQPLTAFLSNGESFPLRLPACSDPTPSTTTTTTTTTASSTTTTG